MTATLILVSIISIVFVLDTFVLVPKNTKILTKQHIIDGDMTGGLIKALKLSYMKIRRGQIWRLFTQVFLHVGIAHLIVNIAAILIAGYALETTIGWQKTILAFFFSAFFSGMIIAFVIKFEDGAGASTGIYGLIAVYLILAVKQGSVLFSDLHWIFVLLLGIYTVVGMFLSKICFWEHLTGFAGGLIFGIIILFI